IRFRIAPSRCTRCSNSRLDSCSIAPISTRSRSRTFTSPRAAPVAAPARCRSPPSSSDKSRRRGDAAKSAAADARSALRRLRVRCALAGSTRRAQLLRCRRIDIEGLRIEHDAVELRRGLRGHVALADVVANLLDRPLERVAVAAATARADFEGVVRLELRHQHLRAGEIALPLSADAQLHRIAAAVEATVEPPRPAM